MTPALRNRLWLAAALVLTVAKLWLSRGQGVYAIGGAGHDDRLFIELAQHLVRGDWLGPYNELTLAKGPFYSLFIAAAFVLGLPLFLAQHVFYAAACGAFVRALRPATASAGVRFTIFAFLLWNPMTYDGPSMGRVLRQHVYGPLGLLILAGLVALYLRRSEPVRRQWPWAVLAGAAAGCFHLTREESLWFAPSVALLGGACLFGAWRLSRATVFRTGALLALGAVVAVVPVLTVSALNKKHYDWFGTCEFRAQEFKDAYGAMLRVRVGPELPLVPVAREAREAMAQVSPQFALLQQQFEAGGLAQGWAGASEFFTKLPPEQGQIGGGWFMWALREAVSKAGHGGDAMQAISFYRQMADEINRACDDGRLPAGPRRSGFMPRWHDSQTPAFVRATREFADFVIRFSRFGGKPPPSTGSPEELQLFRDLTRERLSPPAGELDVVGAARYLLNVWKAETMHRIGKALRPVLMGLFWLAAAVGLARTGWLLWHRRWTYPLTVAVAAGGACTASILMHAMIEVSSFPVHTISSFAPIYPLLLVFIVAVLWDAVAAWCGRQTPVDEATAKPETTPAPASNAPAALIPVRWSIVVAALVALAPFLIWHRQFREHFWFGDDLFLLDQMTQMSPREWIGVVFAENFVPLFKLLWSGAVFGLNGSYPAMLAMLWLTHAGCAVLFARLLHRAGFSQPTSAAAVLVFALTPTNLETLGWATQWSAILATVFLLLGLWWLERHREETATFSARVHLPLIVFAAASACSFSRGVLTGAVLALGLFLPLLLAADWRALARRVPTALLCLLPPLAVAAMIKLGSSGLHQQLGENLGRSLEYGLSYFLLNPWHSLLGGSLHPGTLLVVAALKVGLMTAALWLATGRVRQVLLLLLAYDLGSAVLLGIGRHDTGFMATMSSRYQYSSLLASLPFAAVVLDALLTRLPAERLRLGTAVSVLVLLAGLCLRGWPATLADFTGWRGTDLRRLIAAPATSDPSVRVPALEFMHIERAKALQRTYNLH
jgi:hypothetical protein